LNLLHKVYADLDEFKLSDLFPGRTYMAIKSKANLLGIKKGIGNHGRKHWTEEEDIQFKQLYPNTPSKELVLIFNCSINSIYNNAFKYGLKKSLEYKKSMVSEAFIAAGKKTLFSNGDEPVNKGKKRSEWMSLESEEKCSKTQFKKGQVPHNHQPIGHERVTRDGYTEVKVRDSYGINSVMNFELKHRLLWIEKNGPIPEGYLVAFKDENPSNITIDNLYLLSKKDNLFKNSISDTSICKRFLGITDENEVQFYIDNYPELIELKRRQIKLTRKIKEYAKAD
tara:strand:+ start:84 stop:929 length:846 start_codon:yes stop_codon:yes gene_type:complete